MFSQVSIINRNPADPLHPPAQVLPDMPYLHPNPLTYSAVAHSSTVLLQPAEQAGSPGGWGAVDPTRAECDSDNEESVSPLHTESQTLVQKNEADLSAFSFTSSGPRQHPPPPSPGRPWSRPIAGDSLSQIRKPVEHFKRLLCRNIDRAFLVNSSEAGGGRWVWDVCVRSDRTSSHGVGYSEEYEEYD